ncbi:MAG: hypothetical protein NC419_02640 [Muribaculaceae bacterium]|nr:hypothetical protein [Muribaculaceae bacterium]
MQDIEKRLRAYGRDRLDEMVSGDGRDRLNESIIQKTVDESIRCFYESAGRKEVSYFEFLYEQMWYIRKKWWILQFVVLFLAGTLLQEMEDVLFVHRALGVLASLFVILAVPELWKSRSSNSIEIEGAAYFSLRQIYAARMLIFGVVDGIFLAFFTGVVSLTTTVGIMEMVVQFFLPMIVTCCICFRTLCGRYCSSEYMACFLSMLWTAVWMLFVLEDKIYLAVSEPVWIGICGAALLYLTYSVNRVMRECDRAWMKYHI